MVAAHPGIVGILVGLQGKAILGLPLVIIIALHQNQVSAIGRDAKGASAFDLLAAFIKQQRFAE